MSLNMVWCQKISFEEPNISTIVTVQNMYKKHDFTAVNSNTAKLQKKTKKINYFPFYITFSLYQLSLYQCFLYFSVSTLNFETKSKH